MHADPTPVAPSETAIGQLLQKFTAGDATMLAHIAEDIDFRIDHFKDDLDISWQSAGSLAELMGLLERPGREDFRKGTGFGDRLGGARFLSAALRRLLLDGTKVAVRCSFRPSSSVFLAAPAAALPCEC